MSKVTNNKQLFTAEEEEIIKKCVDKELEKDRIRAMEVEIIRRVEEARSSGKVTS